MQALYAFIQSYDKDMNKGEKYLLNNIEKIYDLYIYLLLLVTEIKDHAEQTQKEAKNKRLPTQEDLTPSTRFLDNVIFKQLGFNAQLKKEVEQRKLSWGNEAELVRKIFNVIKAGETYKNYMSSTDTSYNAQKEFITTIYHEHIADHELLNFFFEEKNIFWVDDLDFVNAMVIKTIDGLNEQTSSTSPLMKLYKDEEDDKKFMIDLFRKTILSDEESEKYISEKTQNWEMDRIAMMDVLLMKMAITEILNFQSIPVKVSLNEYIEISKQYSTPKSKLFINGILDKLVFDFKAGDKIKKTGRGLME